MPPTMDYKKITGWSLIGLAVYMLFQNVATGWADLQDWHGAVGIFTPAFFAQLMRELGPALAAGIGGSLLPQWGPAPAGIVDRRQNGDRSTPPGVPPAAVVFFALVILGSSACASVDLGRVSQQAQAFTHEAILATETLHDAQLMPDQTFQAANVGLNKIAVAGLVFTNAVIAGPPVLRGVLERFRDSIVTARAEVAALLPAASSWRAVILAPVDALLALLERTIPKVRAS